MWQIEMDSMKYFIVNAMYINNLHTTYEMIWQFFICFKRSLPEERYKILHNK